MKISKNIVAFSEYLNFKWINRMTLLKWLFWKLEGGRKKCIFWQNMYYYVLNTEKVKPNSTKWIQKLKLKWVIKLPMGGQIQNWFIGGWNIPTSVFSILLPKLFWPTVRKNCSSDRENLLRWLKQFIQTVKG